jgi:hypothetical protein
VPAPAHPKRSKHIEYHRDGSIRAKGWTRGGRLDGYWEWFRLDGTRLRSGSFSLDRQVGEWTTYDRTGAAYKVTQMPKSEPNSRAKRKAARR